MSTTMIVLVALASGTYLLKAAGPILLGGARRLPAWLDRLAALLPAPLLAALIVTSTFGDGEELVLDARVIGLVVAAIALKLRAPFVVVVVLAAGATGLARAFVS
ncbi:MAG: AzlD domain-containing protein [Acidimicrobiales bacterium]